MATILQNAPVIELIAEARWQLQSQFLAQNPDNYQAYFMKFADLIGKQDFQLQEHLVPRGIPWGIGEPILRFKSTKKQGVICQVGIGFFSVNAITPYQSWENFLPHIKIGFDALISARSEAEKSVPFFSVSLRYIDAFTESLTGYLVLRSRFRKAYNNTFSRKITTHLFYSSKFQCVKNE